MIDKVLTLTLDKHTFKPTETVTGRVRWHSEKPPQEIKIHLAWQTDGRGTQDSKAEETQVISHPPISGEESFSLQLPPSPYSFSGKLIHLQWYVEARSKKGKLYGRVNIEMGPTSRKVILS